MIRKFLICGKHIFLSSKKLEDQGEKTPTCELLLPIDLFWQLEAMLKKIDYLLTADEDAVIVNELYHRVYTKAAKYAVLEKDRAFLYEKIHGRR
jgi:hypothetical protein